MHTVGGTCAHALSVFCLPAFVHCINIQKLSFLPGLKNCKAEYSTNTGFVTFVCWNFLPFMLHDDRRDGVRSPVTPFALRNFSVEGVLPINLGWIFLALLNNSSRITQDK